MLLGNIVFFKDILCTSFLSHAHRDVHSHGFGKESLKKVSTSFLVFCVYIHSTQTPMPSLKLVFQPTNKISKNPYHPQNGGASWTAGSGTNFRNRLLRTLWRLNREPARHGIACGLYRSRTGLRQGLSGIR